MLHVALATATLIHATCPRAGACAAAARLVVPVIRNVEMLSYAGIEKSLGMLANKARKDEISLEDMAGGTFTISNGGVFGSLMGTPIINPPQSAILGMHATKMRPVAVDVRAAAGAGVPAQRA